MKNKQTYSKARGLYLKGQRKDLTLVWIGRITILVAFLGLWELLSSTGVIDPFFFSSPSRVATTIVTLAAEGNLWIHIWTSLYETLIGFAIATALGFILAVALWWSERLRKSLEPYLIVLNSLPKIALGPMIILWVGSGSSATIVMCVLICVVITTISMLNAFISCDNDKILLMRSMHANKWQILFKLIIPNAIPDFISALKINVGMSWVGTIMGEYLSSKAGLGYLINYGSQILKLDIVMASIFILCILATGMYLLVTPLERRYKK
ncbi:MAG: ABC transporter permease [Clostridia bacterium]|nr:ABC transporter permease [Clostridia bacterium]MBQ8792122.1 ABC transporter permease [Clostridia bacterium]